ncbi:hypothetical protein DCAR_0417434 [Daucus carota subsp. sativus]|uniref:Secreted protein n=1 Tax=Daucus carota subsp. sativus TaxID=79200 RepID=A0A162AC53_DAUCS|nr:hypothetical protein DCAR_0417434 [Daucus carota subsp. sativus]
MLPLFLTVAFSVAPLTYYLPPMRNLCPFLLSVEDFIRQSGVRSLRRVRLAHRLRLAFTRLFAPHPSSSSMY